jgi:hypothetical protein
MHNTMATTLRHNPLTTSLQVAKHVLRKALAWCSQHKNDPAPTQFDDADPRKKTTDIEEWDQKFMQVDHHEVILAANYMDIKALLGIGCKTVANTIKGKPPEEIRKTSTQGWKVGRTSHDDDDADSRKTTPGIEEWNEQYILVKLYEPPILLLDVGCTTVANMIRGKPPGEIRKTFNIQNDFTPEEDNQIRRENEWVDSRLEERNLLIKKNSRGRRSNHVINSREGP